MPRHPLLVGPTLSRPAQSAVARRSFRARLGSRTSRRGFHSALLAGTLAMVAVTLVPGPAHGFVLGTRTEHSTGDYPRCLALGDLNGDGRLDVAVVDFAATSVTVLLGDGLGGFSTRTDYTVGLQPLSVALADVNGDGRLDMLVSNYSSNTVSLFRGDGLGGFAPRTDIVTGLGPFSVAISDLNLDGRPDLVTANYRCDSLSVLLGDGAGSFGPRTDYATGVRPRSVTIGDLNDDGRPDLVVTNYEPNTVGVLLGDGAGGFGPRVDFATGPGPFYAAIGDVSGDGRPDLAVANSLQGTISLLLGDGAGGFAPRTDRVSGWGPGSIAIADVGGDARPDVVSVNDGGPAGVGSVSVFPADGAGGIGARLDFTTGPSTRWLAIGDMNGDGRPDVVVSIRGTNTVMVLLGNGGGEFGAKTDIGTGDAPGSVAIGDLSGDGRPDLVVVNSASNTVSVMLGDGAGGFGTPTDYATGGGPASVAIKDLNGNGVPDFAVANEGDGTVSIFPGDGAGGFGDRTDLVSGSGSRSVAIGDVNGDGLSDLAVANGAENTVSVFLGDDAGEFGAPAIFTTGGEPASVAIADVSGDGKPDLAVANASDGTVSVLLGDGAGGYGTKTDFAVGSDPRWVAIGQVNGDGKPDLAVANAGSNTVSVLLGDGAGGFGPRTDFVTGSGPVSVAIGDVNGDAKPDLGVASSASNAISVLLGDGTGGFGPKFEHAAGEFPVSLATADLNGDGRLDLAAANRDAGSVSVLLGLVPTRTVLTASPDPAVVGFPITLTATVSVPPPGYGTPGDSVRFFDGPMLIGTAPVSGGVGTLVLSTPHLGERSLTAVYKGDGKLFGSTSAPRRSRVVANPRPVISRIADVEDDQGGQVSVRFVASALDSAGSEPPITGYEVYRALPEAALTGSTSRSRNDEPATSVREAKPLPAALDGWTLVLTVSATMAHEYELVVTTLADSNGTGANRATFMVRALTSNPLLYYDSAPDSGCSRDNLPPASPGPLNGSYEDGDTHLHWDPNPEPDLCCYLLHRGSTSDFEPEQENLLATLSDTGFVDAGQGWRFYKLAAVDANGNRSVFALLSPGGSVDVTGTAPLSLALERVQPNPTHGEGLRVRFTLPSAAPARLELLDVSGRRVLERAVGALGPGHHTLEFAAGSRLAAGIYVLRLSQGADVRMTRVAVLR